MDDRKRTDTRPTLIYCRESRDENSENYQRIETQRDILTEFCRRRGLVNVVDIILDDDCTGTDFRRLAPVLERVKRKEIRVLVFKDASRLGRNLRECLNFAETVENCGAEILFESEEYNEDFFPLKAWFNEQRAKEDSLKIRRVLRHKMESGTLLVKPFYGYRRGEDGRMIPEEESAKVVRWIFEEARKGRGSGELAAELNAKGIPTPSQTAGIRNAVTCWTAQHIRRIVTNPVYVGTMIHHKTSRKSFKNKKTVRNPEGEWIVLAYHHQPLVSGELFEEVQESRRTYQRVHYQKKNRPFSGVLQCGRCGRKLVLRTRKNRPDAYICGKNHNEGAVKDHIRPDYGCSPHHVREELLYGIVLRYIRRLLEQTEPDVQCVVRRLDIQRGPGNRKRELESRLEQLRRTVDRIYEDRLSGVIREELFARKYREYTAQEEELHRQLREAEFAAEELRQVSLTDLRLEDVIGALYPGLIGKETVRLLFAGILVFEPGELQPEQAEELRLAAEVRQRLEEEGGIVLLERAARPAEGMVPQNITAGWL